MKFGSLFAGIGGFDLGLEYAGMECAWQVEIDDYCSKVLEKHWPHVRRFKDVKETGKHNLEPVDLICGGFPCQPYSVAGKRRGKEDNRNLWPEFLRIVRELRPTWVVGENVPGIVPLYLDQVLSDLEGEAYTCWTFNIPACAFDAPHRRERIWVVAHAEGDIRGTSRDYRSKPFDRCGSLLGSNATSNRRNRGQRQDEHQCEHDSMGRSEQPSGNGEDWDVAYAENANGRGPDGKEHTGRRHPEAGGRSIESGGLQHWTVEPDVGRVAHGVPARVDRLRALGNAVVPQVAEFIGQRILEVEDQS